MVNLVHYPLTSAKNAFVPVHFSPLGNTAITRIYNFNNKLTIQRNSDFCFRRRHNERQIENEISSVR